MGLRFRFAVISDPHIALPETIWDSPNRFHLVEVSIPALEQILDHLVTLDLDFLLLPGDLTQHGERSNHQWLAQRLQKLPFPVYVVPGNHDVIAKDGAGPAIGFDEFPQIYQGFGYGDGKTPYYLTEILPGLQLIGLNSNAFDEAGNLLPVGYLDEAQLTWLDDVLPALQSDLVLVMLHHNVLEHLPGQSQSPLGQRYMLRNAAALIQRLEKANVQLLFTGHLHVQDVARQGSLCEILTGSLVSYPHPFRVLAVEQGDDGRLQVEIHSQHLESVPDQPDLQGFSREWMCDRALPFMVKFLTSAPFNLPLAEAQTVAPGLRHFWATIAAGDPQFDFSHLPPSTQRLLEAFNATDAEGKPQQIDNSATLVL
ncbi:MAG: metallophosphoesterase [Cyanobacteria bacterium Co-bin13]|nr:metallophosphoesterase [Cyanobacteria bacterium Co-bin13]